MISGVFGLLFAISSSCICLVASMPVLYVLSESSIWSCLVKLDIILACQGLTNLCNLTTFTFTILNPWLNHYCPYFHSRFAAFYQRSNQDHFDSVFCIAEKLLFDRVVLWRHRTSVLTRQFDLSKVERLSLLGIFPRVWRLFTACHIQYMVYWKQTAITFENKAPHFTFKVFWSYNWAVRFLIILV